MRLPRSMHLLLALVFVMALQGHEALAEKTPDDVILIVAFGTSVEKARVSYANVEKEVKTAFPGKEIRWAWTAHSLLKTGPDALSPQEALAKLGTEGVKNVAILSLHIIPGEEYSNLVKTAEAFEGLPKGLEKVRLSRPLLSDTESLSVVADILLKSLPGQRKKDEAVVFVGHGTHHPAGVYYPALQYYLKAKDKNAFVGTVEGDLDLEAITGVLKAAGIKKIWLTPLMTVAGDHAQNDLFGDEDDSWKKHLSANGIQVTPIEKGLGENPAVIGQWVERLKKSLE